MKIDETANQTSAFKPRYFQLTLETQAEVDDLIAMCRTHCGEWEAGSQQDWFFNRLTGVLEGPRK